MALPISSALILGIVEGLTEFLPVSSTGHLILASAWLGQHGAAVDAYLVIIQLGALLAAIFYYRRTYIDLATGLLRGEKSAQRLFGNLCLGALPVLLLGYLFSKKIKAHLFRPTTVALALVAGGVLMLIMDLAFMPRRNKTGGDAASLSPGRALVVGLVQALALWPGMSRSMSCIIGGQLVGLDAAEAADFTFLLALPTLGLATVYELLKGGHGLIAAVGAAPMAIGLLTAFLVGLLCIAAFLRYLRRFGLWPFGCYRIAFGLALLALL